MLRQRERKERLEDPKQINDPQPQVGVRKLDEGGADREHLGVTYCPASQTKCLSRASHLGILLKCKF